MNIHRGCSYPSGIFMEGVHFHHGYPYPYHEPEPKPEPMLYDGYPSWISISMKRLRVRARARARKMDLSSIRVSHMNIRHGRGYPRWVPWMDIHISDGYQTGIISIMDLSR